MFKWIKVVAILMVAVTLLSACSNSSEQIKVTQDVELEISTATASPIDVPPAEQVEEQIDTF